MRDRDDNRVLTMATRREPNTMDPKEVETALVKEEETIS